MSYSLKFVEDNSKVYASVKSTIPFKKIAKGYLSHQGYNSASFFHGGIKLDTSKNLLSQGVSNMDCIEVRRVIEMNIQKMKQIQIDIFDETGFMVSKYVGVNINTVCNDLIKCIKCQLSETRDIYIYHNKNYLKYNVNIYNIQDISKLEAICG